MCLEALALAASGYRALATAFWLGLLLALAHAHPNCSARPEPELPDQLPRRVTPFPETEVPERGERPSMVAARMDPGTDAAPRLREKERLKGRTKMALP